LQLLTLSSRFPKEIRTSAAMASGTSDRSVSAGRLQVAMYYQSLSYLHCLQTWRDSSPAKFAIGRTSPTAPHQSFGLSSSLPVVWSHKRSQQRLPGRGSKAEGGGVGVIQFEECWEFSHRECSPFRYLRVSCICFCLFEYFNPRTEVDDGIGVYLFKRPRSLKSAHSSICLVPPAATSSTWLTHCPTAGTGSFGSSKAYQSPFHHLKDFIPPFHVHFV